MPGSFYMKGIGDVLFGKRMLDISGTLQNEAVVSV
jgi:hypothetical protein